MMSRSLAIVVLFAHFAVAAPVPKVEEKTGPFAVRTGKAKAKALEEFGGNEKTEKAVADGLKWLAAKQKLDGSWVFDGGDAKDVPAATGIVLMAYLGAGHGPKEGKDNPHAKAVDAGLKALLKLQKPDGSFRTASNMYSHAIATVALCEAYGMGGDDALKRPAQTAIKYILLGQGTNGSWGYQAKSNGDTCITGWQAQAIRAAKATGLDVDAKVVAKASKFLDFTMDAEKGTFGYTSSSKGTPTLTAIGIVSRTTLDGWTAENEKVKAGAELVYDNPVKDAPLDTYFLYYATSALPLTDAKAWKEWNEAMQEVLLKAQVPDGKPDAGSWAKDVSWIGNSCGKLGTTAFAVLTLENYYRYPFPMKAERK